MRVEHRRVARSSHRRSAQEEPPSSKTSQDCRQRCAVERADADNKCYNPGMRYESPLYLAEESAQLDILSDQRLQLGISRGSPETADRGYRYFGHVPEGSDADMARDHTAQFLRAIEGEGIAAPNPQMVGGTGRLRLTPYSPGLRQRIWWGAGTRDTAIWAAFKGMQLMSSTLLLEDRASPSINCNWSRSRPSCRPGMKRAGTGPLRPRSHAASWR